jgi:hypothetical protein
MRDLAPPFSEMVKMLELHNSSQIFDWDEKTELPINISSFLGFYFGILTCVKKLGARAS